MASSKLNKPYCYLTKLPRTTDIKTFVFEKFGQNLQNILIIWSNDNITFLFSLKRMLHWNHIYLLKVYYHTSILSYMTWHRTTWNVLKGDKVRKVQIKTWQIFEFRQIFKFWKSTPNTTITLALTQSNQSICRIYENQSIELHYSNPVFQICALFAWNCKLQVPCCLYKSYTDEDEFKARLIWTQEFQTNKKYNWFTLLEDPFVHPCMHLSPLVCCKCWKGNYIVDLSSNMCVSTTKRWWWNIRNL